MRRLAFVCLLAAWVTADEKETPAPAPVIPTHDALGFPITFNDEIITRSDVQRSVGIEEENIPEVTLRNERTNLLIRKLSERVAANLGVSVSAAEVDDIMRRQIDLSGGSAKFYEALAQEGLTLERYKLEKRQEILDAKLQRMFTAGISYDRRKLLPQRIFPTPREILTAFKNDPVRRTAAVRARRLELIVDIDQQTRGKLAAQMALDGKDEKWLKEQLAEKLKPRLATVQSDLKKRSFEEVARELGADVDDEKDKWVAVTAGKEASPVDRFLATGKVKTHSEPIELSNGGYRIVYLLERERPADRSLKDPAVAAEYDQRIRIYRAAKWQAVFRLQALDQSICRPARVRDELRRIIVADLREAQQALRGLGIH